MDELILLWHCINPEFHYDSDFCYLKTNKKLFGVSKSIKCYIYYSGFLFLFREFIILDWIEMKSVKCVKNYYSYLKFYFFYFYIMCIF